MTPTSYRLTTLGNVALVTTEGEAAAAILKPGKPLAILIYLASSPRRSASREHLLNLLWSDVEPERGLRTLRQTILQLRRTLGDDTLISEGRDLTLASPLDSDRDDFLAAIACGDFAEAVRLYKGQFLPDFGVPGGAEFEHWSDRERDRLHSSYVRAAETLIRSHLDRGLYDIAIAEARRLRNFDVEREASWRILLESLSSSGDRLSALSEAEELERLLSAEDREPESLTRSAITRAKRAQPIAASPDGTSDRLVADLTGRDREFSRLTGAWTAVKSGQFRHIHLSAPPGLGKTRLLRDVFTRLRATGARSVWLSALTGDRRLAYALASDLAGRIGTLAGASGVSTAAAGSLVALNPTLSSNFAASIDRSEGEEALRRRVHAVTELLEAVAEEAPLALFIDDLHWSDPLSRQMLKSVFARIGSSRILLATSARTVPDGDLHLAATDRVMLEPLSIDHLRELITGFGSLPDAPWTISFIASMHSHTSGSPLLVLENLHLALARGLLRLHENAWTTTDEHALLESIARGDVLEQRLRKLDDRLFEILLTLAVAEEPLSSETLSKALTRDRSSLELDLGILEQIAFVSASGSEWTCAHDTIAETAMRLAPVQQISAIHAGIGRAVASYRDQEPRAMRFAFQHLTSGGVRHEAESVFARTVSIARSSGDRRSNLALAAAMLGDGVPSDTARNLVASLPVLLRAGLFNRRRVAAFSAFVLVAAIVPFQFQPARSTQLAMASMPLTGTSQIVTPVPVIEIQDAHGRRVTDAVDSVFVESIPAGVFDGTLRVAAIAGRATFNDLSLKQESDSIEIRFTSGKLRPVATLLNTEGDGLRFISGIINQQNLLPSRRIVVVGPGADISGTIRLEYSSLYASASVILGATATWGDRRTNFLDLRPLVTPVRNQPRRAPIHFTAPTTPGLYHIIIAFDAEGEAADFISGTNWRLPGPVWNDGNDMFDWTPAQLLHANLFGWAQTKILKINDLTNKIEFFPHRVPATVIDVLVK